MGVGVQVCSQFLCWPFALFQLFLCWALLKNQAVLEDCKKTISNIWYLSLHHLFTLVGTSTPMTMTTYFLEAAQFLKGKDGGAEEEAELVNFLPKKRCFWPKRALSKSSKKCVNCNKIVKVKAFKVFVPTFCAFTKHLPPCKWAKYITSEVVPSPKKASKCLNAFRFCLKFAKKTFLCPNKQVVPPIEHIFCAEKKSF